MTGLRALVLSAGLGTRLQPLTRSLPKPLLPVLGRTLLERTLSLLETAGCEAVAINLHHHGDRIAEQIGERHGAMAIHYSHEPELLGTLGAVGALRGFLSDAERVLLVNGDSLCRWPFAEMLAFHATQGAAATLLVSETAPVADFGGIGVVGRRVGSLPPSPPRGSLRVFAGAHVLEPRLITGVEARPSCVIREFYHPRLAAGEHLAAFASDAPWFDLGTPTRLLEALLRWTEVETGSGVWIAQSAEVEGAELSSTVVEEGALVERGARCKSAVVLTGARIGAGARLTRTIVGPGVTVPAGATLIDRLLTVDGEVAIGSSSMRPEVR